MPLIQSIPYANVAISLFNEHGESYIYGYVPIVVAKCGVFLKEKGQSCRAAPQSTLTSPATDIEGIFRLAGSEKRIKELKTAFDTPPRYGKGLDWTGYTVHDAANILRRYFNHLPEPIIPLQHYDPFRQPLRGHQAEAVGPIEGQAPSLGGFDPDAAVRVYQHNIKGLPSLNRQLLLYILDLLAVFAAKSDVNKMTTSNLAAIFQPGILSHPQHDMSPQDYRLSQDVLIFLIDNQDHFLIGMEGTAVDEGTVKHVESGPPTPQARTPTTPARNNTGIGRSASTSSSAGAASLRKSGGVRRNVSTSSKRSRQSGVVPSPISPAFVTTPAVGVHRSNTVPSKRSPALGGPRFPTGKHSGPSTPATEEVKNPLSSPTFADATVSVANAQQESEQSASVVDAAQPTQPTTEHTQSAPPADEPEHAVKRAQTMPPQKIEMPKPTLPVGIQSSKPPAATPAVDTIPGAFPLPSPGVIPPSEPSTPGVASAPAAQALVPPRSSTPSARSPHHTPMRERSEFLEGPIDTEPTSEQSPAGRTFTQMLSKVAAPPTTEGKDGRKRLQKKRNVSSANPSAQSSTQDLTGGDTELAGAQGPPGSTSPLQPPHPPFAQGQSQANSSKEAFQSYSTDAVSSRNSGTTLKPSMSPSTSFRSHSTATEYSEADPTEEQPKEEKRSFWKAHKRGESRATPTASQTDLHGSVPGGDKSMSSFASSSGWTGGGRQSLQYDAQQSSETAMVFGSPPDHEKHEKKGAFEWFHKLRHDHKERGDKRERAKSPPGSSNNMPSPHNLVHPLEKITSRGRSMEIPRPVDTSPTKGDKSNDVTTPTGPTPNPLAAPATLDTGPPTAPAPAPSSSIPPTSPKTSNSHLPAALTEPKSVARSPERASVSQTTTEASSSQPATEDKPSELPAAGVTPQDATTGLAPPAGLPSRPHHSSSDSTVTITPEQRAAITNVPQSTASEEKQDSAPSQSA